MEENELLYRLNKTSLSYNVTIAFLILAGVLNLSYANAASYNDIVRENQQIVDNQQTIYKPVAEENQKQVSKLEKEHRQIISRAEQACNDHAKNIDVKEGSILEEVIDNFKNLEVAEKKGKSKGMLIFVSFSMPKDLLWRYQEQAKLYGARLVLRGLVENDFQKTIHSMDLGGGKIMTLDINPMLFKDYGITKVPSIVIAGGETSKELEDKFIGAISLRYALEESSVNGYQKDFSSKRLKQLSEGSK